MAEAKVEELLDGVLDAGDLALASRPVRDRLAEQWAEPGSRLRERLEERVAQRAEARQEAVTESLRERESADIARAESIYAAFSNNLARSIAILRSEDEKSRAMLLPDDQARQRQRDLDALRARADELGAEEDREVAAIRARYAEVRPYVTTSALVFALTPADAEDHEGSTR